MLKAARPGDYRGPGTWGGLQEVSIEKVCSGSGGEVAQFSYAELMGGCYSCKKKRAGRTEHPDVKLLQVPEPNSFPNLDLFRPERLCYQLSFWKLLICWTLLLSTASWKANILRCSCSAPLALISKKTWKLRRQTSGSIVRCMRNKMKWLITSDTLAGEGPYIT